MACCNLGLLLKLVVTLSLCTRIDFKYVEELKGKMEALQEIQLKRELVSVYGLCRNLVKVKYQEQQVEGKLSQGLNQFVPSSTFTINLWTTCYKHTGSKMQN